MCLDTMLGPDIRYHATEVDNAMDKCEAAIQAVQRDPKNATLMTEAEASLTNYSSRNRHLSEDIDVMPVRSVDKQKYKKKQKEHRKKLESFKEAIVECKRAALRQSGVPSSSSSSGGAVVSPEGQGQQKKATTDDVAQLMLNTQDKSKSVLQRVAADVQETQQVGAAIADTMAEQTKMLEEMNEQVSSISGDLDRANKLIKEWRRRLAGDKMCLVLIFLVVVAVIVVVIVAAVNPDTKQNFLLPDIGGQDTPQKTQVKDEIAQAMQDLKLAEAEQQVPG